MTKPWMILAAVLGLGCSSSNPASPDDAAISLAAVQCHWPAALDGADGRTACSPARALVSCHDPAGAGCGCTTEGDATCDCSGFVSSSGPWTCTSTCAANQYVVSCGGVGPGPVPEPPAGCVSAGAIPAGIAYYCCPCE